MRSPIWIGIFIGSTIGGLIPQLWVGDMLSYSGVLLSGVGAFVGLWLGRERQDYRDGAPARLLAPLGRLPRVRKSG
jgi:predicted MFS family arabinose efflux permease